MTQTSTESSYPYYFCAIGNTLYFTAETKTHGRELWKSDGTTDGTLLVKDIIPGSASSSPRNLTAHQGFIYFTVDSDLWKSSGTAAGTFIVRKGNQNENFQKFLEFQGDLYFIFNVNFENFLCKTNSNTDGITYLKKLPPEVSPFRIEADQRYLYFFSTNQNTELDLWKWDPLVEDFSPVKNLGEKWGPDSEADVFSGNGLLWFSVYSYGSGHELWRSDGSEQGTFKIGGNPSDNLNYFTFSDHHNEIYYLSQTSGNLELWKSDGTTEGTSLVRRLVSDGSSDEIFRITAAQESILFITKIQNRLQLWSSDGTEANTRPTFTFPKELYRIKEMYPVGRSLYFTLQTYEEDTNLWRSSPSKSGKLSIQKIKGPSDARYLELSASSNGNIVFSAGNSTYGHELWKISNSSSNATLLKDINGGTGSSNPNELQAFNDSLLFAATTASQGNELWTTEGNRSTTKLVKDISKGIESSSPFYITQVGDHAFFSAYNLEKKNLQIQLWRTNGQPKGTSLVKSFDRNEAHLLESFTKFNEDLYFTARLSSTLTSDLYTFGKTLRKTSTNVTSISPSALAKKDDFVYFISDLGELRKTDGTADDSIKVKELGSSYDTISFREFITAGERIYFTMFADGHISELWSSDGTEAGTRPILTSDSNGEGYTFLGNLTAVNSLLYFSTYREGYGIELWKSDGTAEGTTLIKDVNPSQVDAFEPQPLASDGNILYFRADDGNGYGLWKTDGTSEGTVKVSIYDPGFSAIMYGGKLFYSANDGIHGHELWSSDGTVSGTSMVADLTGDSGSALGIYNEFEIVGNKLYFPATTEKFGTELYVFDASGL